MADFLDYVERNYGCVAEYNRSRFEDEEYEAEQQYKRNQYYKENKETFAKAEADGTLVYFSDSCYHDRCPSYTEIGMRDEWDDVEHGICGNLSCKDCTYRKREAEQKAEMERIAKEHLETIKRAYTDTRLKENNKCLSMMHYERADYINNTTYNYDRLKALLNMYLLSEDDLQKLTIEEVSSLLLGLSIHEIAQKMLGEYDDGLPFK